jgi:choline dehydrogenase-like flavoprotein
MNEVLIIGSGISGTAAALRFVDRGIKPCILDVGFEPPRKDEIIENLYDLCEKNDCFDLMIGENFEGLYNLDKSKKDIPAKLTAPRMRFVIERSGELSPVKETNFQLIQSFAKGGLANAWGAALMRYNNRDLEGFSVDESELAPYFDRLTKEIGISGENDDLTPYFGRDDLLQKPLRLASNTSEILRNYVKNKMKLNKKGVFIGRPRLGVLSERLEGRRPCNYNNLEFWQPNSSCIHNPSLTLEKLVRRGEVIYKKGFLAKSWFHRENDIVVVADLLHEKKTFYFECKKLVLAAGAVGSAKLALASRKDYNSKLTLLDNTALQFPFFFLQRIGKKLEKSSFGLTQLIFIYDSKNYENFFQGSILEITSPARAEFFVNFPFAAADNLRMIKYILPAMVVMQLYLPTPPDKAALLSLNEKGELDIVGKRIEFSRKLIKDIVRIFRVLGAYTLPTFVVRVPYGLGIHYAGSLPMVESPKKRYQCTRFGELFAEPNVYAVDGSVFPKLSAKNHALAVMANAMRIADHVANTLRE